MAVPWHIDGAPKLNFPQKSRQLWGGDVSWRSALSYDATVALIEALKRYPTRFGVQQALLSSDFSATGASVQFGFYHQASLPRGGATLT